VETLAADFWKRNGRYGIIAAAYDTELFGHWWFEGVAWLKAVLRRLAQSAVVDLTTAADYVQEHPPQDALALPESSWGQGGGHFTWLNADTEWMWPVIHAAERRMERLASEHAAADGPVRTLLGQAARELLLLQSSDWPFLITTGQARDYAVTRFQDHVERFESMVRAVEDVAVDDAALRRARALFELDNVFPDLDYRLFARREPVAV
jgi:1,4-alpha-glucan branching enzyme